MHPAREPDFPYVRDLHVRPVRISTQDGVIYPATQVGNEMRNTVVLLEIGVFGEQARFVGHVLRGGVVTPPTVSFFLPFTAGVACARLSLRKNVLVFDKNMYMFYFMYNGV